MKTRSVLSLLQIVFGLTLFAVPVIYARTLLEWLREGAFDSHALNGPNWTSLEFPALASLLALLASLVSLVGIVSTTILAWRKERRDSSSYEAELKRRELEIVKLRHEVDAILGSTHLQDSDQIKLGATEKRPRRQKEGKKHLNGRRPTTANPAARADG